MMDGNALAAALYLNEMFQCAQAVQLGMSPAPLPLSSGQPNGCMGHPEVPLPPLSNGLPNVYMGHPDYVACRPSSSLQLQSQRDNIGPVRRRNSSNFSISRLLGMQKQVAMANKNEQLNTSGLSITPPQTQTQQSFMPVPHKEHMHNMNTLNDMQQLMALWPVLSQPIMHSTPEHPNTLPSSSPPSVVQVQCTKQKTEGGTVVDDNSWSAPVSGHQRKCRTVYDDNQIKVLDNWFFTKAQYIVGQDRVELAERLQLTEPQVRIWFQNRRSKWRKEKESKGLSTITDCEYPCQPSAPAMLTAPSITPLNTD